MVTCLLDWTCESFAVSPHTSYLARKISFLEHLVKIFLNCSNGFKEQL